MTDEQDNEPTQPEADKTEPAHEEPVNQDLETEAGALPEPRLERLQKILAQAGVASRRGAEELIAQGRVQVNGKVVTELGTRADAARDHIRVDGRLLRGAERLRYFVLNKPKGYVTTVKDPEGRPTVMEFFARMGERLYPVGRLDFQSEGLLLVTNDGDLANLLTKAASGVEKTYLVKVSGQPTEEEIEQLRSGIAIDRGKPGAGRVRTAPARIRQIRKGDNPWYEVVLIEGRNRELRKMFEEIGHHVEKIRRVAYGPLVLDVEPGKLRELDPEEVSALRATAEGKFKPRRVRSTNLLPKDAGIPAEQRAARAKRRGGKPFLPTAGRAQRPRRESHEQRERETGESRTRAGKSRFEPRGREDFRTERPRFDRRGKQEQLPESRRTSRPASRPDSRAKTRPDWRAESPQDRPARKPFRPRGERPDLERHEETRPRFGSKPGKSGAKPHGKRPPRREGSGPAFRGKGAPGGKSKPAFGSRAKSAPGAKSGPGARRSGPGVKSGFRGKPGTGRGKGRPPGGKKRH